MWSLDEGTWKGDTWMISAVIIEYWATLLWLDYYFVIVSQKCILVSVCTGKRKIHMSCMMYYFGGDLLIPDSQRVHHEFACGSSQTLCKWMYFTNLIVGYVCTDRWIVEKWVDLFPRTLRIAKYAVLINGVSSSHVEVVSLLQRLSNTRPKAITLDVEMEDYYRIKGARTNGWK